MKNLKTSTLPSTYEKIHVPSLIHPYFSMSDELAVHDGLVFRGERIVVPRSQCQTLKEKIHSSHLGIDGCLRRAKEYIYWPNMSQEIRDFIFRCRTFETSNIREPLMSHEVPDRPWAKIGTDIFTYNGRDYLVTVDYMSNFWEIDLLLETDTMTVVRKLKNHIARYGIPDTISLCQKPFRTFVWNTTSPTTPAAPITARPMVRQNRQ